MANIMYVDNIRVEYDNEPNVLEVCRKAIFDSLLLLR